MDYAVKGIWGWDWRLGAGGSGFGISKTRQLANFKNPKALKRGNAEHGENILTTKNTKEHEDLKLKTVKEICFMILRELRGKIIKYGRSKQRPYKIQEIEP